MSLCILFATLTKAASSSASHAYSWEAAVTGVLTHLNVTDKAIEVSYQISNGTQQDIWVCSLLDINNYRVFERYLAEDDQTLMVRRRFSLPMKRMANQPIGCYSRLRSGQSRTESLSLSLPVSYSPEFAGLRRLPDDIHATRLVIEIGYYAGDLPGKIFNILEQTENSDTVPFVRPIGRSGRTVRERLGGSLEFNAANERSRNRDEQVIIPWVDQTLEGEHAVKVTVDDLRIPYKWKRQSLKYRPPDLTSCTKIEIHLQPSALEYFFPHDAQQSLLSPSEIQYLRSLRKTNADEQEGLSIFAHEVSGGFANEIAVAEGPSAHVVCFREDEQIISFRILYKGAFIQTEEEQCFRYRRGLHGLTSLIPQIEPFEYRTRCATNLKTLWYRLRLYNKAERVLKKEALGKSEILYPSPEKWCDAMFSAYESIGMLEEFIIKPHTCPAAGQGRNYYAMNPNCKPDSPPDMVLLFETKAGWNQQGGPELFTFDNHDPRGGCVLLNDGTVKFIRTGEDIHQLRWK